MKKLVLMFMLCAGLVSSASAGHFHRSPQHHGHHHQPQHHAHTR